MFRPIDIVDITVKTTQMKFAIRSLSRYTRHLEEHVRTLMSDGTALGTTAAAHTSISLATRGDIPTKRQIPRDSIDRRFDLSCRGRHHGHLGQQRLIIMASRLLLVFLFFSLHAGRVHEYRLAVQQRWDHEVDVPHADKRNPVAHSVLRRGMTRITHNKPTHRTR